MEIQREAWLEAARRDYVEAWCLIARGRPIPRLLRPWEPQTMLHHFWPNTAEEWMLASANALGLDGV